MYKFKLPIGDWSGDGHEKCEYFIIDSNKPFADVEKAFKSAGRKKDLKEVHPSLICQDYEERKIKPEVWKKLRELGFAPFEEEEDYTSFEDEKSYDAYEVDPWLMAQIVCWFVQQGDVELKLSVVEDEVMPTLHGDRKVSGSSFFGYGCFYA